MNHTLGALMMDLCYKVQTPSSKETLYAMMDLVVSAFERANVKTDLEKVKKSAQCCYATNKENIKIIIQYRKEKFGIDENYEILKRRIEKRKYLKKLNIDVEFGDMNHKGAAFGPYMPFEKLSKEQLIEIIKNNL